MFLILFLYCIIHVHYGKQHGTKLIVYPQIYFKLRMLMLHKLYGISQLSYFSSRDTKDVKNGSGLFLHGTHDEGGTTKHNWSAWCQYNVTGWGSMWVYDMLS